MLRFSKRYLLLASGLLLAETGIALYAHDQTVRPYGGDLLATVFLYCLLRSFVAGRVGWAVAGAVLVSYLIEGLQYLDLLHQLGWQHSRAARMLLGSHFSWGDMLAYSLGALVVLAAEWLRAASRRNPPTKQPYRTGFVHDCTDTEFAQPKRI